MPVVVAAVGLQPVKLDVGRQPAPELTQPGQDFLMGGRALQLKVTVVGHPHSRVVTLFRARHVHHGGGQTDGRAVAAFGDRHALRFGLDIRKTR